jgi:DNA gyrase subunit A
MATNIAPHNLGEVIDACLAYLDDRSVSAEALMAHVPAPDFPTGALILRTSGIATAMTTGRGSILMRSRHVIEDRRGTGQQIVLTEIPYQVGKSGLVEKIADAVKEKRIEGVSDLRDESNREGVRIVLELKRDAVPEVVLNQLWRHTPAQSSFAVNMLALRGGRPEQLSLRDVIEAFIAFREEVIGRRSRYLLRKARERAHLLLGLVIAVANLDEVVAIIRGSASPADAREALMARNWPAAGRALSEAGGRCRAGDWMAKTSAPAPIACQNCRFARSSICVCTASPRWAATRSAESWKHLPAPSPTCSTSSAAANGWNR